MQHALLFLIFDDMHTAGKQRFTHAQKGEEDEGGGRNIISCACQSLHSDGALWVVAGAFAGGGLVWLMPIY
jgi:hypothetical protein